MGKNKDYLITSWRGKSYFKCRHCPFSTFEEEEMKGHLKSHGTEETIKEEVKTDE